MINVGVIGVGRWGMNYLRALRSAKNASVRWICSSTKETLKKAIAETKLKARSTTSYKEILNDREVDAVIIATSASTHYGIAKDSLLSGKHALVEKPVCLNSKDAADLLKISNKKNKILMAGHLHLFNPGIQRIKSDMKAGLFGRINYISITHTGNGPVRNDMSALWDFFPHSVSILLHFLEENPIEISASGASFLNKGIEDIATMNLKFQGNIFAESMCSWLSPLKRMEVIVAGEKLYAVFDDYAIENKLLYCRNRPKMKNGKAVTEDNGCEAVKITEAKPLAEQVKHFLYCIENKKIPINDGNAALKVTKIIECAEESMKKGSAIKLK